MAELQFQLENSGGNTEAFSADRTTPQPAQFILRFDGANSDVLPRGDFDKDSVSPSYPLRWTSLTEFKLWLAKLQRDNVIEFTLQKTVRSTRGNQGGFVEAYEYRCSRGKVHGQKPYDKKHPEREHKIQPKGQANCTARIYIKTYRNTPVVLGRYNDAHSHESGKDNARFTRVGHDTRMRIAELLRTGATPDAVLKAVNGKSATSGEAVAGAAPSVRDTFVELKDIRRIQAAIEAETRHLHKKDDESVLRWVERLRDQNTLLLFKSRSDEPPDASGLDPDVLVLIIQSEWQRERFKEFGRNFAGIDGTHNTTQYQNTTLFTIIVRDRWGHGVPVAWMISSNGKEPTLTLFLRTFRTHNGIVIPRYWMTDKDRAQINALIVVYIESIILLCWWHVLHAWQQHFSISAYPELWVLLKAWIRIVDEAEFQAQYSRIRDAAPASFTAYLEEHWMPDRAMWSAIDRSERSVFERSDTNMLVESWHRILKHKFLQGKHNRRLDDLLYTLTVDALSFYDLKYRRQQWGFEGVDNEQREHQRVLNAASMIPKDAIQATSEHEFSVRSQSDPDRTHTVCSKNSSCTCTSFWTIRFCKHMAAVTRHFPETSATIKFASVWCDTAGDQQVAYDSSDTGPPSAPAAQPASSAEGEQSTASVQRVHALMQSAMARTSVSVPNDDSLRNLSTALEDFLADSSSSGVLPRAVRIPPNIRSTTETQAVLPRAKKSTRAKQTLRYTQPYSAGVRSGTHAQADALRAPEAAPAVQPAHTQQATIENVPPTSACADQPSAAPPKAVQKRTRAAATSKRAPLQPSNTSLPAPPASYTPAPPVPVVYYAPAPMFAPPPGLYYPGPPAQPRTNSYPPPGPPPHPYGPYMYPPFPYPHYYPPPSQPWPPSQQ